MLRFLFKHKFKSVLCILLLAVVVVAGFVIYHGRDLASPARRALQDYHTVMLEKPEAHGISIERLDCLNGKVPTLIVEPDSLSVVGKRGELLRSQTKAKGIQLSEHGVIVKTVVLLHGRNGRKEDLLPVAERFCAVGLRCVLIDMPAHGDSPVQLLKFGADEWEQDLPRAVLLECAEKYQFSPDHAALWGMSMGGSFANSAVADPKHGHTWSSLTIVCSFDSLQSVLEAQSHSSFLTDCVSKVCQSSGGADISQVSPALWIKDVTTPVLVVHGKEDQLIPSDNGKNLYHSYASERKRWIQVAEGNHSNILITPMPLYAEMAEWILQR